MFFFAWLLHRLYFFNLRNLVTPWYLHTFPTLIFFLVIDVKEFLNFPPFLTYFSELTLLFGQLIILLFLCIWTLGCIIVWLATCLNIVQRSAIEPMLYFWKTSVKQPGYSDYTTNLYNQYIYDSWQCMFRTDEYMNNQQVTNRLQVITNKTDHRW